jgi:hypothetical protein
MGPPPPDLVTAPPWTWTATAERPTRRGAYAGRDGVYGPRVTHEAHDAGGALLAVIWPTDHRGRVCSIRRGIVVLSTLTLPIGTPDDVARGLVDTLITLWSTP